jgi:hypothetical protein
VTACVKRWDGGSLCRIALECRMQECRTNSIFVALSQCHVPGSHITAKVAFQEPPLVAPGASLLDAKVAPEMQLMTLFISM